MGRPDTSVPRTLSNKSSLSPGTFQRPTPSFLAWLRYLRIAEPKPQTPNLAGRLDQSGRGYCNQHQEDAAHRLRFGQATPAGIARWDRPLGSDTCTHTSPEISPCRHRRPSSNPRCHLGNQFRLIRPRLFHRSPRLSTRTHSARFRLQEGGKVTRCQRVGVPATLLCTPHHPCEPNASLTAVSCYSSLDAQLQPGTRNPSILALATDILHLTTCHSTSYHPGRSTSIVPINPPTNTSAPRSDHRRCCLEP